MKKITKIIKLILVISISIQSIYATDKDTTNVEEIIENTENQNNGWYESIPLDAQYFDIGIENSIAYKIISKNITVYKFLTSDKPWDHNPATCFRNQGKTLIGPEIYGGLLIANFSDLYCGLIYEWDENIVNTWNNQNLTCWGEEEITTSIIVGPTKENVTSVMRNWEITEIQEPPRNWITSVSRDGNYVQCDWANYKESPKAELIGLNKTINVKSSDDKIMSLGPLLFRIDSDLAYKG